MELAQAMEGVRVAHLKAEECRAERDAAQQAWSDAQDAYQQLRNQLDRTLRSQPWWYER